MISIKKHYFPLSLLLITILLFIGVTALIFHRPYSSVQKYLRERLELSFVNTLAVFNKYPKDPNRISFPKLIAHAGGGLGPLALTNSKEALDSNYARGFRWFEVDIQWTSDNYLVLIHDWNRTVEKQFLAQKRERPTLESFTDWKSKFELSHFRFKDMVNWIDQHQDVMIVTDVKERNLAALKKIRNEFPRIVPNIIPQIYSLFEFPFVIKLGYKNIILTLYKYEYPDDIVMRFIKRNPVVAVTMPKNRALSTLPQKLKSHNTISYAHTINSMDLARKLNENGVFGMYTDFLSLSIYQ